MPYTQKERLHAVRFFKVTVTHISPSWILTNFNGCETWVKLHQATFKLAIVVSEKGENLCKGKSQRWLLKI